MLSILIPTYNTSVYQIVKDIHDLISTEEIDFEILVCDDSSTKTIKENFQINTFSNTRLLINDKNLGRTKTRTLLAENSIYDLLLFIDADVSIKFDDYINRYVNFIKGKIKFDLIYGGVDYDESIFRPEFSLRWVYGKKKEAVKAKIRSKKPHIIVSQNIVIRKKLFLEINKFEDNVYGLDNIISAELNKKEVSVIHIDNNLYHNGLETNDVFLKKSIDSLKTTIKYEKLNIMPSDLRPIQRVYQRLAIIRITALVYNLILMIKSPIKNNLLGPKPSLFLFNLYRLYHYIKLKSNA